MIEITILALTLWSAGYVHHIRFKRRAIHAYPHQALIWILLSLFIQSIGRLLSVPVPLLSVIALLILCQVVNIMAFNCWRTITNELRKQYGLEHSST